MCREEEGAAEKKVGETESIGGRSSQLQLGMSPEVGNDGKRRQMRERTFCRKAVYPVRALRLQNC